MSSLLVRYAAKLVGVIDRAWDDTFLDGFMAIETFRVYTGLTPDRATILPQLDTLRPKDS